MADKPDELAGTQRAAILLMSLGEQDAANLLKQLDAREVQKLGIAMAELKEVSREQMTTVLDKFIGVADAKANIAGGSQDFVRRVLTQAVGKQKADMLLDRVSTGQTGQGIEALKWMESKAVAQIISGEHPQIAAIVLSHLEPEQSAGILPLLSDDMRTEVLMRIATLNEVPQSALTELDQLVEKQANATPSAPLRRIGGARTVANILNAMERDKSGEELGKIEKADGPMHQQIKDLLFIFDNLLDVDDRGIQALLREVGRRICLTPRSCPPIPARRCGRLPIWGARRRCIKWRPWADSPTCRRRRTRRPSNRDSPKAARPAAPKFARRSSVWPECSTTWPSPSRRWTPRWSASS